MGLAARYASGWPMPGNRPGDVAYFAEQRDRIVRVLEDAGRDPGAFDFAGQMSVDPDGDLHQARATALAFVRAGATHVILGMPASAAPAGLARLASEVAEPLRELAGR